MHLSLKALLALGLIVGTLAPTSGFACDGEKEEGPPSSFSYVCDGEDKEAPPSSFECGDKEKEAPPES